MQYDVVVVGGGIAGLTAAAYIAKSGRSVALFEKQAITGGLVHTFGRNGVYFDSGLRSIENSGIVFPMLKQLGINIDFDKVTVSVGIEDQVIKVTDKKSITDYETFLKSFYPDNTNDVSAIIKAIRKIMGYMDVLYGIDNLALMDFTKNKKYLFKELVPWLFRFLFTMRKINKLYEPVEDYLKRLTNNQALIDIIAQHFFKNTPTSFALSYFSLYLDYHYPKGGTGTIIEKITDFIVEKKGVINTGTSVRSLNPEMKYVVDSNGNHTGYTNLVWACDIKQLYNIIPIEELKNEKIALVIKQKQEELKPLKGGDSVFSVYLTVDADIAYFENICTGHFFYTPDKGGLTSVATEDINDFLGSQKIQSDDEKQKARVKDYLLQYFRMNTFEVAIPALRDPDLAPEGKVGVEVSLFLDYVLDKKIDACGWANEFREYMEVITIDILNETIFKGIKDKVSDRFSSSPLTIERMTGNTHGAITGWAFTNPFVPAVNQMLKVNDSVKTILPSVYQAGQWTYSPSGFPMSIVTGKLAADKAISGLQNIK
ncbi:MAG: FAD-dependent oxidoreductase [Prolixibacteraceae bacterium]|nr:FAD-dependent oxidoreductase [Prolixibacteraceae bacterium]